MYSGQDVRDLVITLLEDSSSGFNVKIGTINTERSHSTPTATDIVYHWGRNQYPFLLVDIDDTEVVYDDSATPITLSFSSFTG